MKKTLLFLVIALLGIATAPATCWRINPDPKAKAQFESVQQAMEDNNVKSGDTLLLDAGYYGEVVLEKDKITIIGTGYFLDQKGWMETDETRFNTISLSEGSSIEGCAARYIKYYHNSTVKRCKAEGIVAYSKIIFSERVANALISQCYVTSAVGLHDYCTLKNSIVLGTVGGHNYSQGAVIENNSIIYKGNEYNCISNFSNSTIRNNICIRTNGESDYDVIEIRSDANNIINNNVLSSGSAFADKIINNYYVGATIENTFVNEGSDDGRYQLRVDSPAKGAAANGSDCGAFGGSTPYVLSGLPQFLPHITEVLVPAKPTDGKITVKLKIANQNE